MHPSQALATSTKNLAPTTIDGHNPHLNLGLEHLYD
jgi:hypothetical protein